MYWLVLLLLSLFLFLFLLFINPFVFFVFLLFLTMWIQNPVPAGVENKMPWNQLEKKLYVWEWLHCYTLKQIWFRNKYPLKQSRKKNRLRSCPSCDSRWIWISHQGLSWLESYHVICLVIVVKARPKNIFELTLTLVLQLPLQWWQPQVCFQHWFHQASFSHPRPFGQRLQFVR